LSLPWAFGRDGKARDNVPNIGQGPTVVITDLCVLKPDPETKELVVTSLHPNVTREDVIEATGWDIRFSGQLATTPEPSAQELEVLRDLKAHTNAHHASAQSRLTVRNTMTDVYLCHPRRSAIGRFWRHLSQRPPGRSGGHHFQGRAGTGAGIRPSGHRRSDDGLRQPGSR